MSLTPLIQLYQYALQPIAPFSWFGFGVSTLDVVAAFRLCIALRQIKEMLLAQHIQTKGAASLPPKSFVKDISTTLMVVYGGEAVAAPLLGIPPSFMVSGVTPALYAAVQAVVEYLPAVPSPSFNTELPLAIVDGFTRSMLLCSLIPPTVVSNASPIINSSPWTLLLTSLITANGGFFFTNFFSFLNPTPITVTTPPELQPYGWTTTDIWCAPLVTGLYALLTHAQPFWAEAHTLIAELLGMTGSIQLQNGKRVVEALDPETARAACAILLSTMFVTRTVKNFGGFKAKQDIKEKTQ